MARRCQEAGGSDEDGEAGEVCDGDGEEEAVVLVLVP
jgi:hypothetical protein